MIVGAASFSLKLYGCQSLKEKRFIIKSLIGRLLHRFKISVAEVGEQELWQKSTIGIAMVSSNKVLIEQTFSKVMTFIEHDGRVEIVDQTIEIL